MKKKIFWQVESNGDLSVTVNDLSRVEEIIKADFVNENEGGEYDIEDFQYTVTPVMLTQEEYENLPEQD